jgi:hypothetical protein
MVPEPAQALSSKKLLCVAARVCLGGMTRRRRLDAAEGYGPVSSAGWRPHKGRRGCGATAESRSEAGRCLERCSCRRACKVSDGTQRNLERGDLVLVSLRGEQSNSGLAVAVAVCASARSQSPRLLCRLSAKQNIHRRRRRQRRRQRTATALDTHTAIHCLRPSLFCHASYPSLYRKLVPRQLPCCHRFQLHVMLPLRRVPSLSCGVRVDVA